MNKKLEARVARLEKFIKNEDAELSHLIEAIHNTVNDLIDRINNPERQSKLLDMIIHKEDKAINTIIDFIEDETGFSRGYLLSKRSVIAEEASEVASSLAIYSDWEDKGYFDGDGDFDESVNENINLDKKLEARVRGLEKLVSEGSPMSPWDTGVLAMGDDDEFLYTVWHYDIDQLQSLEAKTVKDLDMCRSALRGRRTVFGPLWRHDKLDLEWRLKCIRGIIKDKKADPDYIPEDYQ